MSETKYGDCIKRLPIFMDGKIMAAGAKDMNGFGSHIIYAFAYETGLTGLSKEPHVHKFDEAIFFLGSDPNNIGDLGAEVEMSIGPKGEEEIHVITEPSVVVMPKGVWHCPMWTKRIDKPYLVMAVSLTKDYEKER